MDENEKMDENKEGLPQPEDYRSPWRTIAFIFIGLIVASAAVFAVYQLTKSDTNDQSAETTPGDSGVELPQNPSLRLLEEEGTIYVENDGNVTMSSIKVSDAAGAEVCDLGTISPGDRSPCPGGTDALRPLTATGSGPQGQPVETSLE